MKQEAAALYAAENDWENILVSPEYFLHRIDLSNRRFEYLKTTRDILVSASFVDGRTALSDSEQPFFLPIEDVLTWQEKRAPSCARNKFIFHMSFCGSTLASRVLDLPGTSIVYKEPQTLLELAEIKAQDADWYRDKNRWQSLVNFALSQYRKPWAQGEDVIIKPSNWANSMLPELLTDGGTSKAIFMGNSGLAFLTSVFRGGGQRIQFTYAVLKHLVTAFPEFTTIVSQVENETISSTDMFARLTLIVHAIQCKSFQRASRFGARESQYAFSYENLISEPEKYMTAVSNVLDLSTTADQLSKSIRQHFSRHSKVTERGFSPSEAQEVDQQVLTQYRDIFARTLEWAEANLNLTKFS